MFLNNWTLCQLTKEWYKGSVSYNIKELVSWIFKKNERLQTKIDGLSWNIIIQFRYVIFRKNILQVFWFKLLHKSIQFVVLAWVQQGVVWFWILHLAKQQKLSQADCWWISGKRTRQVYNLFSKSAEQILGVFSTVLKGNLKRNYLFGLEEEKDKLNWRRFTLLDTANWQTERTDIKTDLQNDRMTSNIQNCESGKNCSKTCSKEKLWRKVDRKLQKQFLLIIHGYGSTEIIVDLNIRRRTLNQIFYGWKKKEKLTLQKETTRIFFFWAFLREDYIGA